MCTYCLVLRLLNREYVGHALSGLPVTYFFYATRMYGMLIRFVYSVTHHMAKSKLRSEPMLCRCLASCCCCCCCFFSFSFSLLRSFWHYRYKYFFVSIFSNPSRFLFSGLCLSPVFTGKALGSRGPRRRTWHIPTLRRAVGTPKEEWPSPSSAKAACKRSAGRSS